MKPPELLERGKGDRERRRGIPEFSVGLVVYLGTYQWSHPLEEVDALPVIDVVRLPALRGHAGRGMSGTGPSPDPVLSDGY